MNDDTVLYLKIFFGICFMVSGFLIFGLLFESGQEVKYFDSFCMGDHGPYSVSKGVNVIGNYSEPVCVLHNGTRVPIPEEVVLTIKGVS